MSCGNEASEPQNSNPKIEKNAAKKKRNKKKRARVESAIETPAEITVASNESQVMAPDTYPLYPGCPEKNYEARKTCAQQKMIDAIISVVQYPESAIRDKVNGVVVHSFIIEADGTMSNLKLTKSLTPDCDAASKQAIIDLMKNSGPWEPGTLNGKKMAVNYSLPIKFKNE